MLRSHESRTAENSAAYLLPLLEPGMALLDVGCGPGTITADLAERVAPGRVTAIDASDGVLARARRHAGERGLATVDFRVSDVHALEFDDATFDVVHAHQVLQHVADPVQALREMRRVCRPGGVVAARDSDYAAMTWYPAVPELDEWLALYQRVARHNGGEPDAGRRLLAWAHEAGMARAEASAGVWCYADDPARSWWSGIWAERMLDSAVAAQAQEYGYASRADLERIADGWRAWGASGDGWFTVLHGEIVCRP